MTLPSPGYGPLPWWVWNGTMKYAEIERQLGLMKNAGMEGWTLWARFGLEMEYLSHDFMQRLQFAVEKSAQLGLEVWAFDEFAWPTCSAKGAVAEMDPAYRMRVLSCFARDVNGEEEITFSPDWGKSGFYGPGESESPGADQSRSQEPERAPISPYMFPETTEEGNRLFFSPRLERALAVPLLDGHMLIEQAADITGSCDDLTLRWTAPAGSWRILMLISRDFGFNIDVLNPDAVRGFLDLTHEKYKRYFGEHFGSTFKGFFSDETRMIRDTQHRFPEPTVAWSKDLFQRLEARGIDGLDPCLAAVFADRNDPNIGRRRLDYWDLVTDIYSEAFYRQLRDWAEDNGVIYTGDCFSEDASVLSNLGDYFKMVRPYHMPGLDALGLPSNQSREHFKSPKFPSSVAHQNEGHGAGRCLCEGPGLLGWGTTIEEMKHVTDWMYVFGVNLLIPNAMHYTIAHEQLYETPSYFFQWTLWPFYPAWDRYTANLGRALTRGVHCAPIAYYYPTETLLSLYQPMKPGGRQGSFLDQMTEVFGVISETASELLARQIDFDYLDRTSLARATVRKGQLELAGESFPLVLVPAATVMAKSSAEKLREFAAAGGKILWIRPLPAHFEDGEEASELSDWIEQAPETCTVLNSATPTHEHPDRAYGDRVEAAVSEQIRLPVRLRSDHRQAFAVHQRRDGEEELLFLVYFGEETVSAGLELAGWPEAEQIEVLTGRREPVAGSNGRFSLKFAPHESKLLARTAAPMPARMTASTLTLGGTWKVSMLDPNLIVAQPVTVSSEWLDRRAWEARLRYRLSFPLQLSALLQKLWWVMDEVQHYLEWGCLKVSVNGEPAPVGASPIIDNGLVAADLARHVRVGENRIELELEHTDYMNAKDLFGKRRSPAPLVRPRLFGSFVSDDGKIAPLPDSIEVAAGEDLAERGFRLYSGRALYRKRFALASGELLRLVAFENLAHHAVVRIDGTEIGRSLWRPWRIDCSNPLAAGEHDIEIEVTNTQANQMFEEPRPFGLLGSVKLGFGE